MPSKENLKNNQTEVENQDRMIEAEEDTNQNQQVKKIIYSCDFCGKDIFSSNYLIGFDQGYFSFSESLSDLNLLKARLDEKIYKEVHCSSCEKKLGFLFVDTNQVSKKRFFIPESVLVKRQIKIQKR